MKITQQLIKDQETYQSLLKTHSKLEEVITELYQVRFASKDLEMFNNEIVELEAVAQSLLDTITEIYRKYNKK